MDENGPTGPEPGGAVDEGGAAGPGPSGAAGEAGGPGADAPVPVAVGLGSNRGDREAHLRRGLHGLAEVIQDLRPSPVYRTRPVGAEGQPWFLNMCAAGRTRLPPRGLLERLFEVERRAGRERRSETAAADPRTLDLDLLLYGDRVIREPGLRVPHPRMTERGFVLVPLSEVAPEWRHPEAGSTVEELRRRVDESGVERIGSIARD